MEVREQGAAAAAADLIRSIVGEERGQEKIFSFRENVFFWRRENVVCVLFLQRPFASGPIQDPVRSVATV
jgi:hypothetical protein